ncbi:rhodanese-like domain-containing protein [Amycolatopsis benzoatilytica]|uniref:rhodanese-like domain-containing protein n=1 Tax=Amycolatopsis benzoatilytica TaxID=346045 RepID=UPI00036DA1EA|nr:rhodanese-like domain-containing protein [Amycolatopsis benzoatilytica]
MKPNFLSLPIGASDDAADYFGRELAFEVDPVDLAQDLAAARTDGYVLVETRSAGAYAEAHLPGAICLPYREITAESTRDLDRNLVYVCYCESIYCNAATQGAYRLARLGFTVKRLSGGITTWLAHGYPVETGVAVPWTA